MDSTQALKAGSLLLLVSQGTVLPLLVRYARVRTRPEKLFLATSSVFMNELLKFAVCVAILMVTEKSVEKFANTLYETVILQPVETAKVCVPSLIYAVQNNLYYVALSNLDAATYCVTYQLKILVTAVFFVCMLRRPLSVVQWCSLLVLTTGVAMVQLQDQFSSEKHFDRSIGQNRFIGIVAVLISCLTSGFAGVYFEKVLKASAVNVWWQNVRLALLGIPLTCAAMLMTDYSIITNGGIFQGYDWLVCLVIALNAVGGLCIAVVIKYADNILKSYAQSVAIVFACIGSALWFGFRPNRWFVTGTGLVIASMVLYSRFPLRARTIEAKMNGVVFEKDEYGVEYWEENKKSPHCNGYAI